MTPSRASTAAAVGPLGLSGSQSGPLGSRGSRRGRHYGGLLGRPTARRGTRRRRARSVTCRVRSGVSCLHPADGRSLRLRLRALLADNGHQCRPRGCHAATIDPDPSTIPSIATSTVQAVATGLNVVNLTVTATCVTSSRQVAISRARRARRLATRSHHGDLPVSHDVSAVLRAPSTSAQLPR